jgi:hypothetical protein
MFKEGTIDYQRVSCPLVMFMSDIFGPEAIIVIVKVYGLNKRLWCRISRIGIRFKIEVSHNFFHLWLDLILGNV